LAKNTLQKMIMKAAEASGKRGASPSGLVKTDVILDERDANAWLDGPKRKKHRRTRISPGWNIDSGLFDLIVTFLMVLLLCDYTLIWFFCLIGLMKLATRNHYLVLLVVLFFSTWWLGVIYLDYLSSSSRSGRR